MDPTGVATKAADSLLSQGTLGTFAVILLLLLFVAGLTIRHLYKDNQALHALMFERLSKALAAIEASTAAIVESRGTDKALGATIEALGKALGELSHENEAHDRDVRHGLNNAAMALGGLKQQLDKLFDRLDDLKSSVAAQTGRGRGPQ